MSSTKTEAPTPTRLRRERKKGNVAQSRDLTSVLLLAGLVGTLCVTIDGSLRKLIAFFRNVIERASGSHIDSQDALLVLDQGLALTGELLLPFLCAALVFAILGPLAQVGPLVTVTPLIPKLERLDFVKGLKSRLFSAQPWIQLLTSLLKVGLASVVCWITLREVWNDLLALGCADLHLALGFVARTFARLTVRVILLFAGLSILDVFLQRWLHRNRLRMSKDEVKREHRDAEGSPEHKAERKRLHEELVQEASLADLPDTDLVAVNPTEIACALRYDPKRDHAPRLLAKGRGALAQRIRELAREHDIPIVRDVPLARALIELSLGDEIPEELHVAAVAVMTWVETLRHAEGKSVRWARADEEQSPASSTIDGTR